MNTTKSSSVSKSGSAETLLSKGETKKRTGNNNEGSTVELNKALASMTVEEIEAQLQARRDHDAVELEARRDALLEEVAEVEGRIAALRGTAGRARKGGGKRGPRAHNEKPLALYLVDILKGSDDPMSVQQLITKLDEVGFKSNAKNKYPVVFTALNKNPEMFRKAERGLYTVAA